MTEDERRQELDRIGNSAGGGRLIAAIFENSVKPNDRSFIPGSFLQAMIDQILSHEFPDGRIAPSATIPTPLARALN